MAIFDRSRGISDIDVYCSRYSSLGSGAAVVLGTIDSGAAVVLRRSTLPPPPHLRFKSQSAVLRGSASSGALQGPLCRAEQGAPPPGLGVPRTLRSRGDAPLGCHGDGRGQRRRRRRTDMENKSLRARVRLLILGRSPFGLNRSGGDARAATEGDVLVRD